jgi:hypothetical protein
MTYREDHYTPTGTHTHPGTHPVGAHAPSGGSAWGLAVVLVVLLGLLGLAMMVGPSEQRGQDGTVAPGTTAPAVEQQTPVAPAPVD